MFLFCNSHRQIRKSTGAIYSIMSQCYLVVKTSMKNSELDGISDLVKVSSINYSYKAFAV